VAGGLLLHKFLALARPRQIQTSPSAAKSAGFRFYLRQPCFFLKIAHTLRLALAHPRTSRVIAAPRKALPAHDKLTSPVSDKLQTLTSSKARALVGLLLRLRPQLHRGISQDRDAVLPVEKLTDKGPADIVLVDRPKRSWN
jgi:hypothetical protein